MPYDPDPSVEGGDRSSIESVRRRLKDKLMADDGVVGVAAGRTATGDDAIVVYVRDASVISRLSRNAGDDPIPVMFEVTGPIDAQ